MPQKKQARPAGGRQLTKAQRELLAKNDSLHDWITSTLVRALRLRANEIHYERGRSGLTVQFRRGDEVLEILGPYKRYQDRAIPWLNRMGRQGLPKRYEGETGRFLTVWDHREWNTPIFHTRTRSGERVVVRFTSWKPWKGLK